MTGPRRAPDREPGPGIGIADLPLIEDEINNLNTEADMLITQLRNKLKSLTPEPTSGKKDKWFDYAASITPSRSKRGFPHFLTDIPGNERRELPDAVLYGPFARILANMDGSKNLRRLIQEAEWEIGQILPEAQIKKYTSAISYLSDYGYLKTAFKKSLTEKAIVEALHELGVRPGDLLFVHSGLSPFGRIDDGAETVINAIMSAIGKQGTALFPTFTMSFIYMDGMLIKNERTRPYDQNDPSQVWVGNIPQTFLSRKGVIRSVHPTHSVAGLGPMAETCLSAHKETDPPTCRNSPFGKLLEHQGKILYFGSGLAPTTFLHFLENEMDLPYLAEAVCRIKDQDGTIRTVFIPKHLPGHRDFYSSNAENCKFFKKVIAHGLEIKTVSLELGELHLIDAVQLYELGTAALREDPFLLLCDNPECLFCARHKIIPN